MTIRENNAAQATRVRPSGEFRDTFLEAAGEYRAVGEELDPAFPAYWGTPFEMYVAQLEALVKGRHLPMSMVPADTFWLVTPERRFVGMSRLRRRLTRSLRTEGGHIGYSIRPSDRRKGYGTHLCAFTIDEARKLKRYKRLLITCDTRNVASARIIEKNGGLFENHVTSPRTGRQVSRYWVTL